MQIHLLYYIDDCSNNTQDYTPALDWEKPAPTKFMNTWRDKHVPLGWEYRRNEFEIVHNVEIGRYARRVNSIEEINGKRCVSLVILQKYGGVFVDADSICIEPIDEHLLNGVDAFAGWNKNKYAKGWLPLAQWDSQHLILL